MKQVYSFIKLRAILPNKLFAYISGAELFLSIEIMARSSSGPGRRPLKAEITGSTPVRATKGKLISLFLLF